MSRFNDDITNFSNEFNSFINTFIELDDKAPFDNNLLNTIKLTFTSFIDECIKSTIILDKNLHKYSENFTKQLKEYNNEKNILIKETENQKNLIIDKYAKSDQNIKQEIVKINEENARKKEAHELDINYFIMSNNQNIEMFNLEHQENISRYTYQQENANLTYQNSISKNNSHLEQKLEKLKNDHSYSLIDYDIETGTIIKNYNQRISNTNEILEKQISDFSVIQATHKENKYKESVELNDKIRKLVTEKNKNNGEERTKYSNSLSSNQSEKEQKRNEYQFESQSISREFVLNMNDLEESITKIKNDYNSDIANEKIDLQYRLLDLHKEQEKIISSIYYSQLDDRNKKRQIKQKNRAFFDSSNLEESQSEKTLKTLTNNYLIETENNSYNKKILELNRTFSIKSINEKELHDNKYYQERNNLDENDLNYKMTVTNNDYNKSANLIRLESSIKTIDIDKDFEKLETLHHIELEKTITDIKKTKIDLNSVESIHKIIHEIEDKKYIKTQNYLVVHNLLEIEKDRVLNEYNKKLYDLNVKKENELLNYSKSNIRLKNHKYKQLKNSEIAIEKAILQNDVYSLNFQMALDKFKKALEIDSESLKGQLEVDKLSLTILDKRFINEVKSINQISSTYINLVVELFNNTTKILDIIFGNIIFRPEYYDIVISFINGMLKHALDYLRDLGDSLIELTRVITNDRLEFEESFKFKDYYELIESIYSKDYKVLSSKKNELEDSLELYQNKINDYNALIFTIQNQILYIKDPKNYALYDKQTAKKNLITLTNKINTITQEANENIAKIEPIKSELSTVDAKLKQLEADYANKKAEIKRRQYYSASAYHNLISNLLNTVNNTKKAINFIIMPPKETKITSINYETVINKKKNEVNMNISSLIKMIYDNINIFYLSERQEEANDLNSTEKTYEEKVIKINNDFEANVESERQRANRIKHGLNQTIRKRHLQYAKSERKCDNLIKKNNNNHNINSKNIINKTSEATQKFYDEFYAICANQKSIIDDYESTMNELSQKYHEDVKNIVDTATLSKKRLDADLHIYINKRKEIINNIPEKAKTEKHNYQLETKRYNQDIDKNTNQAKLDYIERRKEINNNISEINMTYGKSIMNLTSTHKLQLRREKKNHNIQLKHIK